MYLNCLRDCQRLITHAPEKIRNNMYAKENISTLDSYSIDDLDELINELNHYLKYKKSNIFFSFNKENSHIDIKAETSLTIEIIRHISIKEITELSHHYKKFRGIVLDYCS